MHADGIIADGHRLSVALEHTPPVAPMGIPPLQLNASKNAATQGQR
jgi:hypothetical protein